MRGHQLLIYLENAPKSDAQQVCVVLPYLIPLFAKCMTPAMAMVRIKPRPTCTIQSLANERCVMIPCSPIEMEDQCGRVREPAYETPSPDGSHMPVQFYFTRRFPAGLHVSLLYIARDPCSTFRNKGWGKIL